MRCRAEVVMGVQAEPASSEEIAPSLGIAVRKVYGASNKGDVIRDVLGERCQQGAAHPSTAVVRMDVNRVDEGVGPWRHGEPDERVVACEVRVCTRTNHPDQPPAQKGSIGLIPAVVRERIGSGCRGLRQQRGNVTASRGRDEVKAKVEWVRLLRRRRHASSIFVPCHPTWRHAAIAAVFVAGMSWEWEASRPGMIGACQ